MDFDRTFRVVRRDEGDTEHFTWTEVPDDSLDAAWAEAEAALPEGWQLVLLRGLAGDYSAHAEDISKRPDDGSWTHEEERFAFGRTPAAALRALAAKLRERQA